MWKNKVVSSVLCACSVLLALVGCSHLVDLTGIHELSDAISIPDYRRADLEDRVTESDVFQFAVISTKTKNVCRIKLAAWCENKNDQNCPYPEDRDLTGESTGSRTTGFVLSTTKVRIKFPSQPEQTCKADNKQATLDTAGLVGKSWSTAKAQLEQQFEVPDFRLEISRTHRVERRILPGDRVRITAEYRSGGGSVAGQPYTFTDAISTVEDDGTLYISPLFYPPPQPSSASAKYSAIARAFGQQTASARVRIPVWRRGTDYKAQPTVAQIERCLAGLWETPSVADGKDMPKALVTERELCRGLGIDSGSFGDKDNDSQFIRYRLDVQQSWVAVLWNGQRLERPFVPGESVGAGVRRVMREATGRDVFPDWAVYASVDPRPDLRELPFFTKVNRTDALLDGVLIAPGDVIHLSNYRPETRRPK